MVTSNSTVLCPKHFERRLRVVLLLDTRHRKYVLLASSDEHQSATQIAHYYYLNATLSGVNVARLLLAADTSLLNSMNALVGRETNRRVWKAIYSQLSVDGSVDLNRLDSLNCQFWQRRVAQPHLKTAHSINR